MPAASAWATVQLQLVDRVTSGPTNQVTVSKGNFFEVRLNLQTSLASETVTGIDYYLHVVGVGSGMFRIIDRDISTSPWNDTLTTDLVVEAEPDSVLNPRNVWDLGAVAAAAPSSPSTQLVAFYRIGVNPSTPNGSYVIETTTEPGTGWSNGVDDFPFNFPGSYNVMVIP